MRLQPVDSLLLTRPGIVEYFLAGIRLLHALTAILPGLLIPLYLNASQPALDESYLAVLLFFGLLSVLMFQALGIYGEAMFSNLLRFRLTFFAWSASFCLLLFMNQGLALLKHFTEAQLACWFTTSLVLFGAERLLHGRYLLVRRGARNYALVRVRS